MTLSSRTIIIIINLIGGMAVIGSYVIGLKGKKNGANILWGGTSANVKSVYTTSMILSALGYFAFISFTLFKLNLSAVNLGLLYGAFLGILVASTFWMPLTSMYVKNPAIKLWVGIRLALAIVGIASILLAVVLVSLHTKEAGLAYWLAVAGSVYFAFHTAVLDMLLWPIFFKK
jgi:hypothetical protein